MAAINVVKRLNYRPKAKLVLRKNKVFLTKKNYLENFVQSIFDAIPDEIQGSAIVVSGDGRFYNDKAIQVIAKWRQRMVFLK